MKTQVKEIYKCDYCNKIYQIKSACAKHELACSKNPENDRACFYCPYLVKKEMEVESSYPEYDQPNDFANVFYCPKIDSCLYPPKSEHKKNRFEVVGKVNKPMPKECSIFNETSIDDILIHFN